MSACLWSLPSLTAMCVIAFYAHLQRGVGLMATCDLREHCSLRTAEPNASRSQFVVLRASGREIARGELRLRCLLLLLMCKALSGGLVHASGSWQRCV